MKQCCFPNGHYPSILTRLKLDLKGWADQRQAFLISLWKRKIIHNIESNVCNWDKFNQWSFCYRVVQSKAMLEKAQTPSDLRNWALFKLYKDWTMVHTSKWAPPTYRSVCLRQGGDARAATVEGRAHGEPLYSYEHGRKLPEQRLHIIATHSKRCRGIMAKEPHNQVVAKTILWKSGMSIAWEGGACIRQESTC